MGEMSLARKIARRRHALQWFINQEIDPAAVLFQNPPSVRLRRLMHREGLVDAEPLGKFGHRRWLLTSLGRHLVGGADADA
jgi:hypothetical protein